MRFQRYAIGDGHLSGEILQQPSQTILQVSYDGVSPIHVNLMPALPAAARVKGVRLDGKAVKFAIQEFGGFVRVEIEPVILHASQKLTLTVEYEGGIGLVPPMPHPQPGERTSSLKILDVGSNTQSPQMRRADDFVWTRRTNLSAANHLNGSQSHSWRFEDR